MLTEMMSFEICGAHIFGVWDYLCEGPQPYNITQEVEVNEMEYKIIKRVGSARSTRAIHADCLRKCFKYCQELQWIHIVASIAWNFYFMLNWVEKNKKFALILSDPKLEVRRCKSEQVLWPMKFSPNILLGQAPPLLPWVGWLEDYSFFHFLKIIKAHEPGN